MPHRQFLDHFDHYKTFSPVWVKIDSENMILCKSTLLVGFSQVKFLKWSFLTLVHMPHWLTYHLLAVVATVETRPSVFTCSTSHVYVKACMC